VNKEIIEKITGYTLYEDNDDYLVYEDDPKYIAGPNDILLTDRKLTRLNSKNRIQIAENYINNYLNNEFEIKYANKDIESVKVPGDLGILTDIYKIKYEFFLSRLEKDEFKQRLVENILPYMEDELEAKYCCPVKIDPITQQSVYSLNKVMLLADEFDISEAEKLIFDRQSLDSILPTPLNVLSYLEPLLAFNPFAIALPLSRVGSNLYFFRNDIWSFPTALNRGIFDLMFTKIEPITDVEGGDLIGLKDINHFGRKKYFALAVKAINKMMRYFNNPKNFLDENNRYDPKKTLIAHSTLNLLFADLILMNMTNSRYATSRLVFSFLDKAANLMEGLGGGSEIDNFRLLCSYEFKEVLKRIIRHFMESEYEKLSRLMLSSIDRAYDEIFECFRNMFSGANDEELKDYIRTLRNTNHGSFLYRGRFENSFFKASPYVPYEFKHIPFFVAWALAANVDEFVQSF